MTFPAAVKLVEVGPRDGLQNEAQPVSSDDKCTLVHMLAVAGLKVIETGSFVSPKWVPQMAGSTEVFARLDRQPGVCYTALVPNQHGLDDALAARVDEVGVFMAATQAFSERNLNCTIEQSLRQYDVLVKRALAAGLRVRGYLSCVLGCPFQGSVFPTTVSELTKKMLDMGCYEVSLGDTIGAGTAGSTARLLERLLSDGIDAGHLAMHCHDTYGQALANIVVSLQHDIATVDTSVAGLGGCPYAPGATGNVATEDVVYLLNGLGIRHDVDIDKLVDAGEFICKVLNMPNQSRAARALLSSRKESNT